MRFEREIKPYGEPVTQAELTEGEAYFFVTYADSNLFVPDVAAMVFLGRDLRPGDSGIAYFQDALSYHNGIRFGMDGFDDDAQLVPQPGDQLNHIFTYERAVDSLLDCLLRRQSRTQR